MTTDTSERGLERLICTVLTGHSCDPPKAGRVAEASAGYGGVGWSCGSFHDYDREFCVDRVQLAAFLRATQPEAAESLGLEADDPPQRKFLARLQGQISKRGTVEVLRHGVRHGAHDLDLFCGTPSPGNQTARQRFRQNRFTVVRQLRYSRDETQRALDLGLFINGLPVFTLELKNSLTKQTVPPPHDSFGQWFEKPYGKVKERRIKRRSEEGMEPLGARRESVGRPEQPQWPWVSPMGQ